MGMFSNSSVNKFMQEMEDFGRKSKIEQLSLKTSLAVYKQANTLLERQISTLQRQMKLLLDHLQLREECEVTQCIAIMPGGRAYIDGTERNHRLEKIKRCKTCKQEIE